MIKKFHEDLSYLGFDIDVNISCTTKTEFNEQAFYKGRIVTNTLAVYESTFPFSYMAKKCYDEGL